MVCNVQGMDNIIVLKLSKLSYIKSNMREANFDMVQNQSSQGRWQAKHRMPKLLLLPCDTSQLATSDMRNVVTHQSAMIAVCASRANHRMAIAHEFHILQA